MGRMRSALLGLVFVELVQVVVVRVLRGIPRAIVAQAKRQIILAQRYTLGRITLPAITIITRL